MAAYIEGIKAMRVLGFLLRLPKRPTPKNTGPTGFGLSEASAQRQSGPACRWKAFVFIRLLTGLIGTT